MKEKFIADFKEILDREFNEYQKDQIILDAYHAKRPKSEIPISEKTKKLYDEWLENDPKIKRYRKFEFCGYKFELDCFISGDDCTNYYMPDIYTLDEWFDNHKPPLEDDDD